MSTHQDLDRITREAVAMWKNSNSFITQYDDLFAVNGAKIGSTLRIRLPNDWIIKTRAEVIAKTISTKEVIVLGAAAMIARNPIISRRWWGK
jgi:hypothetical protein